MLRGKLGAQGMGMENALGAGGVGRYRFLRRTDLLETRA